MKPSFLSALILGALVCSSSLHAQPAHDAHEHGVASLRVVAYEDGFLDEPARFVQRVTAVRELPQAGEPSRHLLSIAASVLSCK